MTTELYTIGYANKPVDVFISQLKQYRIDAVADIRSVPYSKAFHDYHREALSPMLKKHDIHYVYLGDELGPRSKDNNHYDNCGQIQFDRLMRSALYRQGISRLQAGLNKGLLIALMCAEKDPADCHRSLLVGYDYLHNQYINIQHIDHHGNIERQDQLEDRLMEIHNISKDLLNTTEEQKALAYVAQIREKAYRRPKTT